MKKLIAYALALIMSFGLATAYAEQGSDAVPADGADEIVEFTSYAETPEIRSHISALNIANYEPLLRELARDAFYTGESWNSVNDISNPWSAVYSYLNRTAIDENPVWVQPDGTSFISAEEMSNIFGAMYGATALPQVPRTYSSQVVYSDASEGYTITRANGDNVSVLLTGYAINNDSTAMLTFNLLQTYDVEDGVVSANLGSVVIHLTGNASAPYGFIPDQLTYYPEG